MRACCLFLLVSLARAQFPAPGQAGVVLERDTNVAAGEFSIRAPDNQVYRYRFDEKTAVSRDSLPGGMGHLIPGDRVTVDSDPVEGSLLRYARAIEVVVASAQPVSAESRLRSAVLSLWDRTQNGNLTFAGVVERLNAQSLVLRTRAGEQTLLIRRDTRYVANGDSVGAADLHPNMRVFVRAGKNLYEQVEAYQVVWGSILDPTRK